MTKKEFKSMVTDQTYTGWNGKRVKINAFFFDWKTGEYKENGINKYFGGYKFMVAANNKDISKSELLDKLYQWVNNQVIELPYYVKKRFAVTDKERFKISLSM
jgi:hypothetical protein